MLSYRCLSKASERARNALNLDSKAFVFTLDVLFAIMLLASFILIMNVQLSEKEDQIALKEMKQELSSVLNALDENGYFIEVLDDNTLTSGQKSELIHNKILELFGKEFAGRTHIVQYDLNMNGCLVGKKFEECFYQSVLFSEHGAELPKDKSIASEEIFLIKKQPPAQCEISEQKLSLKENEKSIENIVNGINKKELLLLFDFDEKDPITLLFEGETDQNIFFGVSTTPSKVLNCDETIHVDLNVRIGDTGERTPADIMLVMDRSGSMDESTVPYASLGSGSFNEGLYECSLWWYWWCISWQYTHWQTLATFEWNNDADFAVRMYYSGDSGSQRPRLRLRSPTGTYYPNSSGRSTISPIIVESEAHTQGTWTVEAWSDDLITYDLNLYIEKMFVSKNAAKNFIDLAEWKAQDFTGLVSFSSSAKLEQPLTSNRTAVKNKIDTLVSSGNTNIGGAIYEATEELQKPPLGHGREEAKSFQILLSDGKSNTGPNPITAAQDAASKGIIIYTIGFGDDADEAELTQIAEITGGQYYYAEDENTLQAVYEYIALEIGASLNEGEGHYFDANVMMPVPAGMQISDTGNGSLIMQGDQNFLYYYLGDMIPGSIWQDYFNAVFPCDVNYACEESQKTFPSVGTVFNYSNSAGEPQPAIDWNAFVTVDFKYRDLTLDILKAEVIGENQVLLDVKASNIGWLSSDAAEISFYLEDPQTGQLLKQETVQALCGKLTGCNNYLEMLYNVELNNTGYIYGIINKNKGIRECPNNNIVQLYCTLAPKTQYYVISVQVWKK